MERDAVPPLTPSSTRVFLQRYRHLSASLLALHRRVGRIELWIVAALVAVIGGLGGMTWALLRMALEG